ncbi:MAG: hypothetical protein ACN6ON_07180, partial [Sphingobacterium sp.]
HRFVRKKNGQIVLAGDGNLVLHEYIETTDIIGIASKHYPINGSIPINIDTRWSRLRGLGWYYIRLLRRIVGKLHF